MANSLTNVAETLVSMGVATLRQNAVMARLVNTDKNREASEKNAIIRVPVPTAVPAQAVTAGSANTATDLTPGAVNITLDQWYEGRFKLSDRELQEVATSSILPMAMDEAIKGLANNIDSFIITKMKNRAYGVVEATDPAAVADITGLRRQLHVQLAPPDNRRLVLDPVHEAELLNLDAFRDLDRTGTTSALMEGTLGRKLGFDIFMDQNFGSHTAGTGTNYIANGGEPAGETTIAIDTGSGTVLEGDIVTFAGDSQTYVVTTGVAAPGNIVIYPPLQTELADSGAMTIKATHAFSLAFHRDAFMFASRPMSIDVGTPGVVMAQASDPISGISLRVELLRLNKESIWSLDVLYGGAVARPELQVRYSDVP